MANSFVKKLLGHPATRNADIDAPATSMDRRQLIREKGFLRKLYNDWYDKIKRSLPTDFAGPIVELGSGGGFLKEVVPNLVTSDILMLSHVDLVFNGQNLPFRENSLKGIILIDVFHHIARVNKFLDEAARCLKSGGVVVMVEPWNSQWSRLIYQKFHHEPFEVESKNWEIPSGGPLSQSNQALPWIVFERDRAIFEEEFYPLRLESVIPHTPFRYLLSGGVSFRSLMPAYLFGVWSRFEELLEPWMKYLAMFATITLVRADFA
jgi:SAM-dependent methyltransferase